MLPLCLPVALSKALVAPPPAYTVTLTYSQVCSKALVCHPWGWVGSLLMPKWHCLLRVGCRAPESVESEKELLSQAPSFKAVEAERAAQCE